MKLMLTVKYNFCLIVFVFIFIILDNNFVNSREIKVELSTLRKENDEFKNDLNGIEKLELDKIEGNKIIRENNGGVRQFTLSNNQMDADDQIKEKDLEKNMSRYSSTSVYFILTGILILISIFSTLLIRDCIVDRIRMKNDSFLQTVMDTVFRQAACIFMSLAIAYCLLTSRLIDHIRNYCEKVMTEYSEQTIINEIATKLDNTIINNYKVWTSENLGKEFNNILAVVTLTFAWYCLFVLYFTGCVKFLEKWIRFTDDTDVGVLIKTIYKLQNLFNLKKNRANREDHKSEDQKNNNKTQFQSISEIGDANYHSKNKEIRNESPGNIPITILRGTSSTSSYKLSNEDNKESFTEKTREDSGHIMSLESREESITYISSNDIDQESCFTDTTSNNEQNQEMSDVEEEMGFYRFSENIELDINKTHNIKIKNNRDSYLSKKKKQDNKNENISWKERFKLKQEELWSKFWLWPNQILLTYMKAHFVSLRYDFMDEVATYDNYGSFSSNFSGESNFSTEGPTTSWLISLTDPTTSLVAGVYFTEYLRAKLLILAVTLIRIPITTLTFILAINLITWLLIYDYYHNIIVFNNVKHYFSEPMICSYISIVLLVFSLTIWMRAWLIKRQLQPKNILEYLKMKYSLDIGMPQQEIEYEKIMPRYKINKTKTLNINDSYSKGGYSQLPVQINTPKNQDLPDTHFQNEVNTAKPHYLNRIFKYLKIKVCGTNNPSLHDNLFYFKKNGPVILLRWFQASYFLQLILISIVIHLSYLQKKLWYNEFSLATSTIWCIFALQHLCLPFILYPILLCTSVGQMADKLVLEQVLAIQKTQNIERLSQISEALRFYSFLHLFTNGDYETKELQRRKYSILAKTAPWELQVRCRNTMNFLINNAPVKTKVSLNLYELKHKLTLYFYLRVL